MRQDNIGKTGLMNLDFCFDIRNRVRNNMKELIHIALYQGLMLLVNNTMMRSFKYKFKYFYVIN